MLLFVPQSLVLLGLSALYQVVVTAAPDSDPVFSERVRQLKLDQFANRFSAQRLKHQTQARRCSAACSVLAAFYPSNVVVPGSTNYSIETGSYWAQQQTNIEPACFFEVQKPIDVSVALVVARITQCPFAVRSGGHSDIPGASSIPDGITINLRALNQVVVSADRSLVHIGPGATWGNVYKTLDPQRLTVTGGRESSVGVGGLTLGGGISFFSGHHGFACDGVAVFELVMADGYIRNVTRQSNPDLFFALRGGGNNFGIVVGFYTVAYQQGLLWGGISVYPLEARYAVTSGFENFTNQNNPDMALITSFSAAGGVYTAAFVWDYNKPQPYPPITQTMAGANAYPQYFNTNRIAPLSNFTDELGATQPPGFRNRFTTATYKNSAALQDKIVDHFLQVFADVNATISNHTGLAPIVAFQPLTNSIIGHFADNGGNALGISSSEAPLMLCQFNWAWASSKDDKLVNNAIKSILSYADATAKEMGLYNPYIYLNYAALDQDPFSSYGARNKARLQSIRKKYDPAAVFQKLQPGYFKLS